MKNAGSFDPRVDAYINKSAAFAQPVLTHVRELVHKTLPDIEEDLKWSMPFFIYRGQMFGNLAAFKAHCSFGLFGAESARIGDALVMSLVNAAWATLFLAVLAAVHEQLSAPAQPAGRPFE